MADQVLKYGVSGISDLVAIPGLINLDLADVRRVMVGAGICHMGIGRAKGQDRMEIAIDEALNSPLLDTTIDGAHRLIVNFTGSNLKLREVNDASSMVRDIASPDADIIIGAVVDDSLEDEIMITVIASGFDPASSEMARTGERSAARSGRNSEPRQSPRREGGSNWRGANYGSSYRSGAYTAETPVVNQPAPPREQVERQPRREEYAEPAPADNYRRQTAPRMPEPEESEDIPAFLSSGNQAERPSYDEPAPARNAAPRDNSRGPAADEARRQDNERKKTGRILPWFFSDSDEDVNGN